MELERGYLKSIKTVQQVNLNSAFHFEVLFLAFLLSLETTFSMFIG